jgi:metal-responsive CopG/Arc/MetJ family transcriptional regulator
MTERKSDILNLRLDPALAREIDRIADWRGKTASEVARDLLQYGIAVERDLEAEELKQPFGSPRINRGAENTRVLIEAKYRFYTVAELARFEREIEEGDVVETRY